MTQPQDLAGPAHFVIDVVDVGTVRSRCQRIS